MTIEIRLLTARDRPELERLVQRALAQGWQRVGAPAEFYVVASENMRPIGAVGPLRDRAAAAAVVRYLQAGHMRFPLSIAMRRPVGIPIMPAEMFVLELEAAMRRARSRTSAAAEENKP